MMISIGIIRLAVAVLVLAGGMAAQAELKKDNLVVPLVAIDPCINSWQWAKPLNGGIGHALRGTRYRYIYYEHSSLEELYDHESDPNEFTNLAYGPSKADVVARFRSEMEERVGRLSLEDMRRAPDGFTVAKGEDASK